MVGCRRSTLRAVIDDEISRQGRSHVQHISELVGDALGGIVSDRIFEKTLDRKKARRDLVIFGFLCSMVLMIPVVFVHNLALVAILLSAAFFFAEFTVGPMWAIPMDIAPRHSGFASVARS